MYSILLTDDERLELETLRDFVPWAELGIGPVLTARGGRAALEIIREREPDILITDIQMPVMDGVTLARAVRDGGYQTKVIFLTGYDDFEYVKAAFQVNAIDYILKPFTVDGIEAVIGKVSEVLKKERAAEDSRQIAVRHLLTGLCGGSLEFGTGERELLRELTDADEAFGLILYYGPVQALSRELESRASQIRLTVSLDCGLLVVTSDYVNFRDTAEWIGSVMQSSIGYPVPCIYSEDKTAAGRLSETVSRLKGLKDPVFFLGADGPFGLHAFESRAAEWAAEEASKETWQQADTKALCDAVRDGSSVEAAAQFRRCMAEMSRRSRREWVRSAYRLYLALDSCDAHSTATQYVGEKTDDETLSGGQQEFPQNGTCDRITVFLEQMVTRQTESFRRRGEDPNFYAVNFVKEYVNRHFAEQISVDEIAQGVHLSPNYLRSIFKESTGMTVLEYITDYRFEKACGYLKDQSLKIREVSIRSGYDNASYFSTLFTKKYGMTPNEYRKKL